MVQRDEIRAEQERRAGDENRYTMRISRQTVDKLGVKLYDRVSAVVAELVANAYDADAEHVRVSVPLATLLASKSAPDPEEEEAYFIEVADDGHGMTPSEVDRHFLKVGANRRTNPEQGARSRSKDPMVASPRPTSLRLARRAAPPRENTRSAFSRTKARSFTQRASARNEVCDIELETDFAASLPLRKGYEGHGPLRAMLLVLPDLPQGAPGAWSRRSGRPAG